ncbi:hypothetical protein [Streptomyces sp. NPDC001876]|uniref:hypothetical protein n=1 Tax=Streptomyces sp. NPDC001876 TaxID=3154402 RepID=UPI00332916E5
MNRDGDGNVVVFPVCCRGLDHHTGNPHRQRIGRTRTKALCLIAHEYLVTGLASALKTGALTADAVTLEASKAANADAEPEEPPQPVTPGSRPGLAPLPAAVRAQLPPDTRPLPSVAHYDQLLRLRQPDHPTP